MNELSRLRGSEGYGACDDEAYQGERKRRREIRGQERLSGRAAKQGFIKTTNSFAASCFYPHSKASRRTANIYRQSAQLFME